MATRKTKKVVNNAMVSVGGSIGGELHTFAIESNETLRDVFAKASINLSASSEIIERQTGDIVSPDSKPVANHIYYVSEKYKSQNL